MTDLVIAAHESGLRLDSALVEPFAKGRSNEAARSRLEAIARWLKRVNGQNHDGVILTPPLVDHLAGPRDIDELLQELDHLRKQAENIGSRIESQVRRSKNDGDSADDDEGQDPGSSA